MISTEKLLIWISCLLTDLMLITNPVKNKVSITIQNIQPLFSRKLGDMGKPTIIPLILSQLIHKRIEDGYKEHNFNRFVSDLLPLNRRIADVRDPRCKDEQYAEAMPSTSIIICFHNEAMSTLLRTIYSVINRTPQHLIHEIILVDDFSDKQDLREELKHRLEELQKVKLIRTSKREGLVRSRLLGVRTATASVITFLDSHCECAEGWLEPLLHRISENNRTIVCPVIDNIKFDTFQYKNISSLTAMSVGGFTWGLNFIWHLPSEKEVRRRVKPRDAIATATLAGGLFAVNREYFISMGTYDPEYEIWGAENLELSFKTWMCGGRLEIIPCSHIGHVFRRRFPYKFDSKHYWTRNTDRLAEVWLDEYKKYYYERIKKRRSKAANFGDISQRIALRKQLRCKSFKWYLDYVYPKIFIPDEIIAFGEIRNRASNEQMCLDTPSVGTITVYPCHKLGGNQHFQWSTMSEIRNGDYCLDVDDNHIAMKRCYRLRGYQHWRYSNSTQLITHTKTRKCLRMYNISALVLAPCEQTDINQRWLLQNFTKINIIEDQPQQISNPPFETKDYKFLSTVDK